MTINKYVMVCMVILAVPLGILGANTLEYMCHYAPPQTWYFIYPQKFAVSFWNAYFFGGMLPYASSFLLFGIVIGYILNKGNIAEGCTLLGSMVGFFVGEANGKRLKEQTE